MEGELFSTIFSTSVTEPTTSSSFVNAETISGGRLLQNKYPQPEMNNNGTNHVETRKLEDCFNDIDFTFYAETIVTSENFEASTDRCVESTIKHLISKPHEQQLISGEEGSANSPGSSLGEIDDISTSGCSTPTADQTQLDHGIAEPDPEEENYGMSKIRAIMSQCRKDPSTKPSLSYIALIALSIQNSPNQKLLLSEIYQWIVEFFPHFGTKDRSWRNSIRHNLSLNECFIKSGRSENGKGHFWAVHPANVEDFGGGDFRRRRARRRVRKCVDDLERLQTGAPPADSITDPYYTPAYNTYVPMTTTRAPAHVLISMFGAENILTREEIVELGLGANGSCPTTAQSQATVTSPEGVQSYMDFTNTSVSYLDTPTTANCVFDTNQQYTSCPNVGNIQQYPNLYGNW